MGVRNIKAGRLLSKFIRQIAEETKFVKGSDNDIEDNDDDRMVSRAELLAREMWRIAEGWTEVVLLEGDETKDIKHAPDPKMMTVLMDRLEGRCGTVQEDEVTRPSAANKISDQGKKRIAAAGGIADDTGKP